MPRGSHNLRGVQKQPSSQGLPNVQDPTRQQSHVEEQVEDTLEEIKHSTAVHLQAIGGACKSPEGGGRWLLLQLQLPLSSPASPSHHAHCHPSDPRLSVHCDHLRWHWSWVNHSNGPSEWRTRGCTFGPSTNLEFKTSFSLLFNRLCFNTWHFHDYE